MESVNPVVVLLCCYSVTFCIGMCVSRNWDVSLWWLRYRQITIQLLPGSEIFVRLVQNSSGVHPFSYPVSVLRALSLG